MTVPSSMQRWRMRHASQKTSAALVLTLAVLVLISALLILFFDQSLLNREISFSSSGQYRADVMAHLGLDTIVGDLRSEIVAGSTTTSITTAGNTSNLYIPSTNFAMVPCRVDTQGFTNLVAQSASSSNFWSGSYFGTTIPVPVRSSTNNNTATASANGRFVAANRWNAPGLLADPGSGAVPLAASAYTPPDWVIVTRQGAITNATTAMPTLASLADKTASNQNYAVGRYAYTVYDEGALLDANVAGYPSGLSGTTFATERGLLAQIDLANLFSNPPIGDANGANDAYNMVIWRNTNSGSSLQSYTNYVANASAGFVNVASGDQAFASRQDLINYIKNNSTIPTGALQYLGTFTRDLDGPSYSPTPATYSAAYFYPNPTNAQVLSIRAQSSFLRASDNTQAVPGEPLLKHRFPLSLLALFQNPSGTTGGVSNASLILTYFAMQQSTSMPGAWEYVDPDSHAQMSTLPTIKTLAQVAAANREPTFWELLQAGMLNGSLGANIGTNSGYVTMQDALPARQVFSAGLSIIGQYLTNNSPTVLDLGGESPANTNNLFIAGDANIPYPSWIALQFFQDFQNEPLPASYGPSTNAIVDGYLMFTLWNPHRNASTATPGTFRIKANGTSFMFAQWSGTNGYASINNTSGSYYTNNGTLLPFHTTTSRTFSQIDGLRPSDIATGQSITNSTEFPYPAVGSASPLQVGILLGQVVIPTNSGILNYPTGGSGSIRNYYVTPLNMDFEQLVNGNWIPYQGYPGFNVLQSDVGANFGTISTNMNMANSWEAGWPQGNGALTIFPIVHSDPRTTRMGVGMSSGYNGYEMTLVNNGPRPISFTQVIAQTGTSSGIGTTNIYPAGYVFNNTTIGGTGYYYADPDGIIRQGDPNPSGREITSTQHLTDSPFGYVVSSSYTNANPVMLNRPFTSVAEMGYAFRDDPWRSLDFQSQYSADGGLLDLFCLNANTNSLRAGVLDLNGASVPVLSAVLNGAYMDPATPTSTTCPYTLATNLATLFQNQLGPIQSRTNVINNISALPTVISQMFPINSTTTTTLATTYPYKFQREMLARSFADIANTRTWNLMIDVIAQSGRYTSNSKTVNDFIVEGERRYWLHVAIDRYTGEIVAKQLEPVSE